MIPLGPFDLDEPIGRGGMARVWRGVHREQGVPVAIKVLSRVDGDDPDLHAAFRREVRAVAALSHPNVVLVFEYGKVPDDTAVGSRGLLEAGRPYLAMELADGGTLSGRRGKMPWRELKQTLLSLLDGLAHAHARGVVHRDLKPGNVLVGGVRPGVKLTDFGLAHLGSRRGNEAGEGHVQGGTPLYMAPEQFSGRWRDFGPWTDLYALGCMTWSLVCGRPPYPQRGWWEAMDAHLNASIPRLQPAQPVPDDLAEWVARLMQKDPADRFARAADAAWALRTLPDDVGTGLLSPLDDLLPNDDTAETLLPADAARTTLVWTGSAPPEGDTPVSLTRTVWRPPRGRPYLPPLPLHWERPEELPSMRLVGAGLGLFGLRAIPMVGRHHERSALWEALRRVKDTGQTELIALVGASGCGKSRLAEWLCERGHELGAIHDLKATHSPIPSGADGIGPMIARLLNTVGLQRPLVHKRVSRLLGELDPAAAEDADGATELVCPATAADGDAGPVFRFSSARERHLLIERLLARFARGRALVVWLDDVQWGADALGLAHHLLEVPLPLVVVVTVREEALVERPTEATLLDEVLDHQRARRIAVGPLPPQHRTELVRQLLGLEGPLAARVEARTAGNPLFAVQLVGDWVERGLLQPTDRGFALRPGATVQLPDGVHELWSARVARLLRDESEDAAQALELAASLGQDVAAVEWRSACRAAGVRVPRQLVETLLAARLALPLGEAGDWSFVHGMLRESVLRAAESGGRLEGHHRICAQVVGELGGVDSPARVGRHLLAAGEIAAALEPLGAGTEDRLRLSAFREALDLVDARERAMDRMAMPQEDDRWGLAWMDRAEVHRARGEYDECLSWSRTGAEAARRYHWPAVLARALWAEGWVLWKLGRAERGRALMHEAGALFEQLQDWKNVSRTLVPLALTAQFDGDLDLAAKLAARAVVTAERSESTPHIAEALRVQGALHLQRGDLDAAFDSYRLALEGFEREGRRTGIALSLTGLADVFRFKGDLDRAAIQYARALAILDATGSAGAIMLRINLGAVQVQAGRYPEARTVLERCMSALLDQDRVVESRIVTAFLLPCWAHEEAWQEWADGFGRLGGDGGAAPVDADVAKMAELAGDIARRAGRRAEARQAWRLAAAQWQTLGRDADARRAGRKAGRTRKGGG